MLENIVYKLLDLTYPKLDTQDLPNKLFKLNSSSKIIYLGGFIPFTIDKVFKGINYERREILKEIKRNSFDLGLKSEDLQELNYQITEIVTYEDFTKKHNRYKNSKSDTSKDKFKIDKQIEKEAYQYASQKIKLKESKFELTLKEVDRYEEKYIKEFISKLESKFKANQADILQTRKSNSSNFTKEYPLTIEGYKKYIEHDDICYLLQEEFNFFIPSVEMKKHTYISGMTGSGKSELIKLFIFSDILKRLKSQKLSTVLIEPHGDMSLEVVKFTENYKNEDLIYISPSLDNRYTVTINPFEMREEDKTEQNIDILASELLGVFKMILGSSFTLPMESVLLPTITTILYLNNPLQGIYAGIEELQRFMDDNHNSDLIEFAQNNLSNINQQIFFKSAFKNKSLSVTKQALYTKIQTLLNSSIFSKLIQGKSTIDLEEELNTGKLIVINLSKGLMGDISSKFFGALVIALINQIVLKRVHQNKEDRTPINLIIDESQNYLTGSIETALTELRKYGLHLTLVSQIVGQNLERILLSNTNIKIVGVNATDSLDKLSKEIQVSTKELQKLTVGEFFIKIGNKDAIKFKSSSMLLNNENTTTLSQYHETKKEQLAKYYKRVEKQSLNRPKREINLSSEQVVKIEQEQIKKPMFDLPPE